MYQFALLLRALPEESLASTNWLILQGHTLSLYRGYMSKKTLISPNLKCYGGHYLVWIILPISVMLLAH